MAAEVVALPPVRLPSAPSALTPDQRYWATFTSQLLLPAPNASPITHLSSNSPSLPFSISSITPPQLYIAVTTGTRLQLLSTQTLKPLRTIGRTSSPFHGATIRKDGRVCIAGSDSGTIQVFDCGSRSILKTWSEHKQPVWTTRWHPRDLTGALSCGDDTTVRLWDLPAEQSTWTGWGHQDYVRCGEFVGDGNLIVSGSYDQSIRLWDPRVGNASSQRKSVMNFKLSAPVEAVLALPGGTTIVGAAGDKIAVLDLVAGKPLHLLRNHQKTVTSLAIASRGSRVLAGALDGHVKVFETSGWSVVTGFKYPSPVLSLSVIGTGPSNEDRHLCVGMQSGLLSIRTRLFGAAKALHREKQREMAALVSGTIEAYDKQQARKKRKRGQGWEEKRLRGKDYTGEGADIVVMDGNVRGRLRDQTRWEAALRRGRYEQSLDLALDTGDRTAMLTLLTALVHRSALRAALANRSASGLMPLLKWLGRHIGDPRYVRLTTDVAMTLLDLYGEHLGQSRDVDVAIEKLHHQVRGSTEVAHMCWSTSGMLDLLQAGAGGSGGSNTATEIT